MSYALALANPGSDIDKYLAQVYTIPVLSREEELELTQEFFKTEDVKLAHKLVISHLRFVVHIAKSYAGYGFAVPVNLMKKVVNDLMKYGQVQRAILGVSIQEITQDLADEKSLKDLKGVYIADVIEDGAAEKAGMLKGDVIVSLGDEEVNSSSRLQELVGKYRPGDKVKIIVIRDGKEKILTATLLSKDGEVKLETASVKSFNSFDGMEMVNTTRDERSEVNLKNGVKVSDVKDGCFKDAGIPEGFYISHINNEKVYSARGAVSILNSLSGSIVVEGKTRGGKEKIFAVKLPKIKGIKML